MRRFEKIISNGEPSTQHFKHQLNQRKPFFYSEILHFYICNMKFSSLIAAAGLLLAASTFAAPHNVISAATLDKKGNPVLPDVNDLTSISDRPSVLP